MTYDVISSGSKGNALVLGSEEYKENQILIDCGVPFKALREVYKDLELVLLTHIHGDHFNKKTIRKLANERPTLRFGCCAWLAEALIYCGVNTSNIDIFEPDLWYSYGITFVSPIELVHDVPNCGYKLNYGGEKIIYATDTANLNGIEAKNYDYYFIEANYDEDEIKERISKKEASGEYPYEKKVLNRHLSYTQCNNFIYENMGANSRYVYMHQHQEN